MSEPFIQNDFGGFNPRFLGVSIRFQSSTAFEAFQDYLVGDGIPADEPALSAIGIRSVMDHEMRHYHDFLLSPYSAVIFRMRLQALMNGMKALPALSDCPGTYIPVPLVRWIRMTEAERNKQLTEWREDAGISPDEVVKLPFFSPEALKQQPAPGEIQGDPLDHTLFLNLAIEHTCRAYLRIGDLTAGFTNYADHPELVPYNFYEVVALAAQMQSIVNGQGAKAFELFHEHLEKLDLPYARLWRTIQGRVFSLLERFGTAETLQSFSVIDHVAAMAFWCLLGNYQLSGPDACPTRRFLWLLQHLEEEASEADLTSDVGSRWSHWDRSTPFQPWTESLLTMFEANQKALKQCEELAARNETTDLHAQAMRRYVSDQKQTVLRILGQPEDLIQMNRYVNAPEGVLPIPLLRLDLESFGVPLDAVNNTAFKPMTVIQKENGERIAVQLALRLPSQGFNQQVEEALKLESHLHLCDLVFSEHTIPSIAERTTRAGAEGVTGKKLLNLL